MVNERPPHEMETLLNGESTPVIKPVDDKVCCVSYSNTDKSMEIVIEREDTKTSPDQPYYVIPLCKAYKISVYKPLLPLRIALFLWYGAGKIPVLSLSIFMKMKGLSVEEYSWIFAVASVFQFFFAFASGIIADKLGNAKPVLMTHVLITIVCILSLLFCPKVNLGNDALSESIGKNYSEEFLKNFQKCEEFKRSSQHPNRKILKAENYSELEVTQLIENCTKFNGTILFRIDNTSIDFDNQVSKTTEFGANYSNTTIIPCKMSTENCTELNHGSLDNVVALTGRNIVILIYFIVIIFLSSWSTVYHFMDVTIMSFTKSYNVSFGYEHFFSLSGYTFMTFLTSVLLSRFTPLDEETHHKSLYVFSACILFLSLVPMYFIKPQMKPQSKHMWKDSLKFIRNNDVTTFVVLVFLLGSSFGCLDNFCLWFLEHLSAPTILFGLHQTIGGLYGLPVLFTSSWWLKKFNPRILFFTAFLGYAIFGLGFSLLYNPWWSLVLESSGILTYHLLWVAVIVHAHSIAPEGLSSTIIAITGATHYSIGRIVGTLSFGLTADKLGPRTAFGIFSGMNFLYAVCYILFMFSRKTRVVRRECY